MEKRIMEPITEWKDPADFHDDLIWVLTHGYGVDTGFYSKQLEKVFAYDRCELQPDFLGFTSTYRHLALMIPLHFTIIDFGCNHACQSFYFDKHKKYIGIDSGIPIEYRLQPKNAEHFFESGVDFIKRMDEMKIEYPTFAISNYVPSGDLNLLIRAKFQDLFIYYPKSKMPTRS